MSFYRRVKYFMVHTLMLSNKKAQQLIDSGCVELDGTVIFENCFLSDTAELKVNGHIEQQKKELCYLLFYKPAGFESTLNTGIEANIAPFFTNFKNLAIAGRLDKQSEGLLLLSNDGKWVEQICNPKFEKEKEYQVTLNNPPDAAFVQAFTSGVRIGNYTTKPCTCTISGASTITVILTEGKNRQIRRMCKALGYNVLTLKRTRIESWQLNNLAEGKFSVIKI